MAVKDLLSRRCHELCNEVRRYFSKKNNNTFESVLLARYSGLFFDVNLLIVSSINVILSRIDFI